MLENMSLQYFVNYSLICNKFFISELSIQLMAKRYKAFVPMYCVTLRTSLYQRGITVFTCLFFPITIISLY